MTTILHADWLAKGYAIADDPRDWPFVCPHCGDVATGRDIRKALDEAGREDEMASDLIGQVCIGRIAGALDRETGHATGKYTGRGCDWCAFGLFRGPVIIELPDGKTIGCFEFAAAAR